MKIEFTNHAKDKFLLLKAHGFQINEDFVLRTVANPDKVIHSRKKRIIAQKR